MRKGDKSVTPSIAFTETKSVIESYSSPIEGMEAITTDTHEKGFYNGSAWVWGGGGGYTPPATTADNDFQVGIAGAWVKKTLTEVVTILRTLLDSVYSPISHGSHIPTAGAITQILQWASSGVAKWITLSGDATISDGGVVSVNKTRENVRNETGSTIATTRAVYTSGFNNFPLILLADNTNESKHNVVGVTVGAIAHEANGYIVTSGQADAETNGWTVGTELYLSTAGNLTSTEPTSGSVQHVGIVMVQANYPAGKILLYTQPEGNVMAVGAGQNAIIRMGDSLGVNKVSFRDYANTEVASINSDGFLVAGGIAVGNCGSRLSLSATEPNPTTEIFNATMLYVHFVDGYNYYPQYNSMFEAFRPTVVTGSSRNVSALAANQVYDVFLCSGNLCTGQAWSTSTSRGAAQELSVVSGIKVNSARQTLTWDTGSLYAREYDATYIGTICTTSTAGRLEWSKKVKSVWNKYNRLPARFSVTPGGTTLGAYVQWSIYSVTWVEALYSATWRIKYVLGEPSIVNATHSSLVSANAQDYISISIGYDTTTQPTRKSFSNVGFLTQLEVFENNHGLPVGIGSHYIAALYAQYSLAGGASTIYSSLGTPGHMHGADVPPASSYLQAEIDL